MPRKFQIDDVAHLAGVSKATVDRVINNRPGVSAKSTALVRAALKTLGAGANPMAPGGRSPTIRVEILLPKGENQFFALLHDALITAARAAPITLRFSTASVSDPAALAAALTALPAADCVLTTATDAIEVRDAINSLTARGVRVITLVSDAPLSKRHVFVGLDNFAAGRSAGTLLAKFTRKELGKIGVLVGHLGLRDHLDRRSGFEQALTALRPETSPLMLGASHDDPARAHALITEALRQHPDLIGLYVAGAGNRGVVSALRDANRRLVTIGHEYTPDTRSALLSDVYDALIAHDIPAIAHTALQACRDPNAPLQPFQPHLILMRDNLPPL